MRVIISHNKQKDVVMRSIDTALDDAMKAMPLAAVEVTNIQRAWTGSTMAFSLNAKAGFLRKQINGTVEVTDTSVILEADLGFLEKLFPVENFKRAVQNKVDRLIT